MQMNESLFLVYPDAYNSGMSIANRLDRLMRERHYPSQSALARASGVPQPTIARILKGSNIPELQTLMKLATTLGVTSRWLADGPDAHPEYTGQREQSYSQTSPVREAQITEAVNLMRNLSNHELSKALGMLQEFAQGAESIEVPEKIRTGGENVRRQKAG